MSDTPAKQKKRSLGIRLFGYCINKLWLLLASLIILTALVHLLLGFLLPKIDLYRENIVSWVEQTYDVNVEVDTISAEWSIQGPVIALSNFKLKSDDGQFNILEVGEVSLYFDMLTSLWDQRFSTKEIVIDQANLKFYIDQKLGVQLDTGANVANADQSSETSNIELGDTSQKLIDILFGQRQISITDSTLKLFTLSGTQFDYHIDLIKVEKFSRVHQLSGQLDYGDAGQISLVTELYGDPKLKHSFSEIYLRGVNVSLADLPWLDSFPISPPSSGNLSWQFWGTWRDTHWQSAKALLELDHTNWSKGSVKQATNHLSTMMSWQHDDIQQGYLSFHNMSVQTSSNPSQTEREKSKELEFSSSAEIYLKYQDFGNNNLSWILRAEDFTLAPFFNYVGDISDEKQDYAQFLKKSDLSLLVNQLSLSLEKKDNTWQAPTLELEFSDLEYNRWETLPRANGLSGKVKINQQGGQAQIGASNTSLEFGELFRHAIIADDFSSDFNWSFDRQGQMHLNVDAFYLTNADLNIQARSRFFYQDKQPVFSLYTEITNVNTSKKSQYLPVGVMSGNLVSYLDASVKSGKMPIIKSVVRGPIKEFPFANNNGLFVALGMLQNATYQYLPDWPEATELDAKLLFEGNSMDIVASNAKSLNNQVRKARAVTKDFSLEQPILELSLDVISKDNSARDLISHTPISFISDSLQSIDYFGQMRTNIAMKVGLSDNGQVSLTGGVKLDPKGSNIKTPVISVDRLKGEIKFTEEGIAQSELEAFYLDKKLQIHLHGQDKPTSPKVSLDIKGILPAAGISHFIGERWQKYFSGETEFSSLIHFSPADKTEITRVLFQSKLEGLAIDFPDEFGKKATEKDEIFLSLELAEHSTGEIKWKGADGKWYWDSLEKNNQADTSTEKEKNNLESTELADSNQVNYGGTVFINRESEYLARLEPGLRVKGDFDKLNLHSWLAFIKDFDSRVDTSSKPESGSETELGSGSGSGSASENEQELVFESIEVNIQELESSLLTIKQSRLNIEKQLNTPWKINLSGEQGQLELILNPHSTWQATLNDLNIQFEEGLFDKQNELLTQKELLSPEDLVDIDIKCINCIIQQKDYGEVIVQIRKEDEGVSFLSKIAKSKQHDLVLSGGWMNTGESQTSTEVQFNLRSPNGGSLLKKWDLDVAIEDSSVELVADLSWQDAPWNFDYLSVDADMHLNLGKGYLSDFSDEKGRLFSLFNLQSLVRKLTFDFKDVYKKGFFYDSLNGSFQLRDGVISTENVRIKGNVADVKLFGQTDIKNETIEQVAVITPHLTSSLPVLAAWAIEPTTGIIIYLLDKIMEPAVEVATRIDYRIHGSFEDVKVDTIKTSKEKVKVEYQSEIEPESDLKSEPSLKNETGLKNESKSKPESDSTTEIQDGKVVKQELSVDESLKPIKTEKQPPVEEPVP